MDNAKYLIRFDDICPTMDWDTWDVIENEISKLNIKPIVAIVPDNKDRALIVDKQHDQFWSRVRSWQENGWTIAMHGYQHLYKTDNPGLLKLNKYSEFSGLHYEEQRKMVMNAKKIFECNGITPKLWVAPAHSFDENTINALLEIDIRIISDGFYTKPIKHLNMIWMPQQLWRFHNFRSGIWTVCYHINGIENKEIEKICSDLKSFRNNIKSLDYVLKNTLINPHNIFQNIFSIIWLKLIQIKRILSRLTK
mgnify:CR=1 FL=1